MYVLLECFTSIIITIQHFKGVVAVPVLVLSAVCRWDRVFGKSFNSESNWLIVTCPLYHNDAIIALIVNVVPK